MEPYHKSKIDLYSDSIILNAKLCNLNENNKVLFEQFVGIGPRRYFDLFSLLLGSGYNLKRKNEKGEVVDWSHLKPKLPRTPFFNLKYLIVDENYLSETNIGNFKRMSFETNDKYGMVKFFKTIQEFLNKECLV
jgi:hypothetical protein